MSQEREELLKLLSDEELDLFILTRARLMPLHGLTHTGRPPATRAS